jgi:predicted alpha/beta superfamily hydrolase
MKLAHRILALTLFAAMLRGANAESVTVSINQSTTFGDSVFVLSDLPEMGAGDLTKAVRLSPVAGVAPGYPVWSATFDLPPNTSFVPKFYTRSDSPTTLGTGSNGTLVFTGAAQSTAAAAQDATVVQIYAGAAQTSGTATITSPVDGSVVTTIPLNVTPISGGNLLTVAIPAVHANHGRLVRFGLAGGVSLPTDAPVSIGHVPVWWKFSQGFLSDPAALTVTPSAPRIETFSFSPVPIPPMSAFQSRTIRVMLPRNYDTETTRSYPVMYAEDGQNLIFPGGGFGYWDLNVAANSLTARGEFPETIIIGIDNTSDRFAELVPEYGNVSGTDGRGGEFLKMIRDQLMPEVASRYRVLTGPANTTHLGSSLGGLLGFHAANEFEATFGTVIAMSPSFQVNNTENNARAALPPGQFGRIYIDSGTAGTSNDGYWNTANIRDYRMAAGEVLGGRFTHAIGIGDQHNETAWRGRTPNALRWMMRPSFGATSSVTTWDLY